MNVYRYLAALILTALVACGSLPDAPQSPDRVRATAALDDILFYIQEEKTALLMSEARQHWQNNPGAAMPVTTAIRQNLLFGTGKPVLLEGSMTYRIEFPQDGAVTEIDHVADELNVSGNGLRSEESATTIDLEATVAGEITWTFSGETLVRKSGQAGYRGSFVLEGNTYDFDVILNISNAGFAYTGKLDGHEVSGSWE